MFKETTVGLQKVFNERWGVQINLTTQTKRNKEKLLLICSKTVEQTLTYKHKLGRA